MKQRTLKDSVSTHGKSLHTGREVRLTLKPAEPGHGILFRRTDLYGKPEVRPSVELVTELVRSTDISTGHAKVHTVEHVLSALHGMGIDNCAIEMDASEPPILDGSAREFVRLIERAGIVEQEAEREYYHLDQPISIHDGNRSLVALPHDGLRITCTSADDRGIHTQHLSIDIDPESYGQDIAHARTFTIYEDIEELIKMGKIRGGSLDSAVVIKGDKILSKDGLRYRDEFVRHKILDIIGDIVLLGRPLRAHIVAVRPGHALNFQLTKALHERMHASPGGNGKPGEKPSGPKPLRTVAATETHLDIRRILDILPHAYPFVLVDRVLDIPNEKEIVAIKNVTINEPFFTGHFPGRPVMPGVLQLEAMAQTAGILMLKSVSGEGKVAFFMSANKVKFRQPVTPGDQIEIRVEILKVRAGKLATAQGRCRVGDKVVSEAELMFTIMDVPEND